MLGVAGLWKEAGCDLFCRLCWGMKGKNVGKLWGSSVIPRKVRLTHGTRGHRVPAGGESQGFHLPGLEVS